MQKPINPAALVGSWIFFVVSFAFPPLLIVSGPIFAWNALKLYLRYRLVTRSRDYYTEERNLINASRLWRAGR